MSSQVRVYEIADDLKMDYDIVVSKIRTLGIEVKNKMSKVDAGYIDQIKSALARDKQAAYIEVEVAPGVIRRKPVKPPEPAPRPPAPAPSVTVERSVPRTVSPERSPGPPVEVRTRGVERPAPAPAPVSGPAVTPAPLSAPTPEPARVEPAARDVEPAAPVPSPIAPSAVTAADPTSEPRPEESSLAPSAPAPPAPVTEAMVTVPVPATLVAVAPRPETEAQDPPREPRPRPEPTPAPAVSVELPSPAASSPQEVSSDPASAHRHEPTAPPVVAEREEAPTSSVLPAAPTPSSRPSQPAPRKGIAQWNPITKQIEYFESPSAAQAPRPSQGGLGVAQAKAPGAAALPQKRVEYVPNKTPGLAGKRPIPGRPMMPGLGGRPGMPRPGGVSQGLSANRGASAGRAPQPTTQMAAHKRVIKIEEQISLQELARRMSLKATDVLLKLLGIGGKGNINSTLDSDTAKLLASEFGYEVEDVALDLDAIIKTAAKVETINEKDVVARAPVVTVMGHVDHGKTTLLDKILGTRVADGEAGGITQEVRAYRVKTPKGTDVVFFDTPGHEAFTALRARGAQTTDVAVLVVAADDGVMPTTVEAINHAKAARVPLVVVLNKMDKPDARPDRVLQELMRHEVIAEEFGGETLVVKVSAKTGAGIDVLLDNLALQTDVLELKANGKKAGVGTVFESKLDKGKGAVARVLVQEGVVRNGDVVLAGTAYGRIRAMFDDRGKPLDKAGPSTPVEILGLNEPPTAGDKMYVCADLRKAQEVAERLKTLGRKSIAGPGPMDINAYLAQQKDTQITVHVVIKADAQGAVEGLRKALTELSTDKVKVQVIHGAVGAITETDVQLAVASRAVIIGFNVRPIGKAGAAAEEQKIELRYYNVIYEAVDDIKALMLGQLKPTLVEKSLGRAEVRQVFNITKVGTIAGCMVQEGEVRRGSRARLLRDGAVKHDGRVGSLRRFKEDAAKVAQGFECGVGLENYNDLKPGDVIECYEHEEVAAQL